MIWDSQGRLLTIVSFRGSVYRARGFVDSDNMAIQGQSLGWLSSAYFDYADKYGLKQQSWAPVVKY